MCTEILCMNRGVVVCNLVFIHSSISLFHFFSVRLGWTPRCHVTKPATSFSWNLKEQNRDIHPKAESQKTNHRTNNNKQQGTTRNNSNNNNNNNNNNNHNHNHNHNHNDNNEPTIQSNPIQSNPIQFPSKSPGNKSKGAPASGPSSWLTLQTSVLSFSKK